MRVSGLPPWLIEIERKKHERQEERRPQLPVPAPVPYPPGSRDPELPDVRVPDAPLDWEF